MKAGSSMGTQRAGGRGLFLVCTLFVAAGSGIFAILSAIPLWHWFSAQGWETVPCDIVRSEVMASTEGNAYRIDIEYTYAWAGESFSGDRYNFFSPATGDLLSKQLVVDGYPPGAQMTCYVDPADPGNAVLNRDFSPTYLIGCFGLIFVFAALAFAAYARHAGAQRRKQRAGNDPPSPRSPDGFGRDAAALEGKRHSRIGCGVALVIAIFWNSILWATLLGIWSQHGAEAFDAVSILVLTPFVLVGLALLAGMGYFVLARFNPRPLLALSRDVLPLGGEGALQWSFRGNPARIHHMVITLCGQEKVTYSSGKTMVTETRDFSRTVVMDTTAPNKVVQGNATFSVPEFTAPSFDAPNNKIIWSVKVHGGIRHWPDVNEVFPIHVSPLPGKTTAASAAGKVRDTGMTAGETLTLKLDQDPATLVPGQVVEGTAGWNLDAPPGMAMLRLFWYTEGKGTQNVGVIEDLALPANRASCLSTFRMTIPEAPYSFQGTAFTLQWAFELNVGNGHHVERLPLVVSPWVEQVTLTGMD